MIGFKARCTNEKQYAIRLKISETKIRQIVRLFAVDLDALQIAQIADVNRNTVTGIWLHFANALPISARQNLL